jgi:minor histocompatibility antigen H13
MLLSCCFTAYYVMTKHWIASNVFGVAFATSAVSMIHLDSFLTGMTLLAGLFVYDIFWVFGTDVMVTVAKNFDIPVKLLFPRNILEDATGNFTLLGLGDIVIPGVFIALCLKFDKKQNTNSYFAAGLVAYVAGLLTTMAVMHTFKAAQPALLYLSPACILSALSVALVKGQLPALFAFSTETKQSVEPAKRASPRKNKSE